MRKLRTALQVVVTSQGNPETMERVTEKLVKERSDTAKQTADREQQLAMAVYEAEGRVKELQRERDNWQQQHSRAQAQATKSKGEVSNLRHQLTAAQATQAQAARELRQQTLMVEELTALAADATMYAMDLTENGLPVAALGPTSRDADELEAATRALSARAKEAGSAAGSLMMLEAQLRAKTLEVEESKRSLLVAERELKNVSTQLEGAQAHITTLQEELRQLKAQVSDLRAELATRPTEQQLADLEAELTAPLELAERSLAEVVDATSKRESKLAGEMRQLERSLDAEKAARMRATKELEAQLQVRPFSAGPLGPPRLLLGC
jgi:chromosome segregation ATPase